MGLQEVLINATNELINAANINLSLEEVNSLPQDMQTNIRIHNLELSLYLSNLNVQSLIELMSKTGYLDKSEYQTVLFTQLINDRKTIEAFAANGESIKESIRLINSNKNNTENDDSNGVDSIEQEQTDYEERLKNIALAQGSIVDDDVAIKMSESNINTAKML